MEKAPQWLTNIVIEDLGDPGKVAAILGNPRAGETLAGVAMAEGLPLVSRVLAHELLMESGRNADPAMAEIYCRAIPECFLHNWWGMPGQFTERLGNTLVSFGKEALPCLYGLLSDKRPLGYFGSEEPTLNRQRGYRVSDLAAYFMTLILGKPYEDEPDPLLRDHAIERLRIHCPLED